MTAILTLLAACGDDAPSDDDVVDDIAPDTSFTSAPGDLDTADDSELALACDEAACTFECSVDEAAFAPCDAALSLGRLALGEHTLAARATDAAGNVDATPATHTWSLAFGWSELAAGNSTVCAISGEGGLYCWGREYYGGELGNGGGIQDVITRATRVGTDSDWSRLVSGENLFCALRGDATYCWGSNEDGLLGDPAIVADRVLVPTLTAHQLATLAFGEMHGCGIDDAGALSCWGNNYSGQLGSGDKMDSPTPVPVGTASWTAVSLGQSHTCAIDDGGALWCWGDNSSGQCGQTLLKKDDVRLVPSRVGTASDWVQVSAGAYHTCAREADGALWCWGANYYGELGDGTTMSSSTPVAQAGSWRDVLASYTGSCAVADDGAVSCWGDNTRAQLGSVTLLAAQALVPEPISYAGAALTVVGRLDLRCALADRDIVCWGDNQNASGGLGRGVAGAEPQVIAIDGGWNQLAINHGGGCGVRGDGTLACWGLGFHVGQPTPLAYAPVDVSADTDWFAVDVTADGDIDRGHACGLRDGLMSCWGRGNEGQLGDGTATTRMQATELAGITNVSWTQVSTGTYSTCAITANDELYCWGGGTNNFPVAVPNYGQVGDGTQVQRNAPVQITTPAATGWVQVELHGARVSAVRSDGTLWGWGINPNGAAALVPTQIGVATGWESAVSTGANATCAIRASDKTLWCSSLVFDPGWARPLIQVGTATDHASVIAFEGGVCSLRTGAELHCYWATPEGWTDNFPFFDVNQSVANPPGAWASFVPTNYVRCGLRADGTRECAGFRFTGSLGDGFDERQPTAILLPDPA